MNRWTLLLLVVMPFLAGAKTGNELLDQCKNEENAVAVGFCLGYIQGALDGHATWEFSRLGLAMAAKDASYAPWYCIPSGATLAQAKAVFMKYAADNPENLHAQADWILGSAMKKAFACPTK